MSILITIIITIIIIVIIIIVIIITIIIIIIVIVTDISLLTLKIGLPFLLSPTPLAFVIHPRPQVFNCQVKKMKIFVWNWPPKKYWVFTMCHPISHWFAPGVSRPRESPGWSRCHADRMKTEWRQNEDRMKTQWRQNEDRMKSQVAASSFLLMGWRLPSLTWNLQPQRGQLVTFLTGYKFK